MSYLSLKKEVSLFAKDCQPLFNRVKTVPGWQSNIVERFRAQDDTSLLRWLRDHFI